MLCHEYKCIYVHIPKVAGLSIHNFFAAQCGYKLKAHASIPFKVGHIKASEFMSFQAVNKDMFNKYFKFSFVRNPWARMVSEYKYRGYSRHYDFKTFIFNKLPEPTEGDRYIHILPQYDFLHDENGRLLVDFVGRFERLQEDFDNVCIHLGITETSLPHTNKGTELLRIPESMNDAYDSLKGVISIRQRREEKKNSAGHYTKYYDAESREYVASMFQKDLDAFGYKFDS